MKINLPKLSAVSITVISLSLLFTTATFAVGPSSRPESPGFQAETRLQNAKLKSCQAKENSIKKRSEQITKMSSNMEEKFDTITQRVTDYYTTKVVPSGKIVLNYDVLVADIDAKKAAVQTALIKAQNDLVSFSCGGSDPKAQMMIFREDMQGVKQELKDYRTAIKDLIVVVRSVTGEENSVDRSPQPLHSPKPSKSSEQKGNE